MLRALLAPCRLCPNECDVDRTAGQLGRCGIGADPRIASYGPHFGEERPLVGRHGSGTVFFSGCSLGCVYCQNWEISQHRAGRDLSVADLAASFLDLQSAGCHNLNLVTPTHQAPAIVAALAAAAENGFRLPVVWNCSGYESLETLRLLDGIVDIYMPDLKYGDDAPALRLSGVKDYVRISQAAIREMHRQVGDLLLDRHGVAIRGLLVRHLVLPHDLSATETVVRFIADAISVDTYVNLMDQYRPAYRVAAHGTATFPNLVRPLTEHEFARAKAIAIRFGLHRIAN
jgi:putative pyruvate formate lyase activating enzyme